MPRLASTNFGVDIRNPLFHHFDEALTSVPPQGDLDRNRTQVLPVRLQIFNREQSSSNELFVVNIGHFWEYLN